MQHYTSSTPLSGKENTLGAKPPIFKVLCHPRRMTMAVVNIGHYYAEWMPSGSPDKSGRGRIILRSATRLTELFRLTNLGSEDYRNVLHMLQTEKPVFWDSEAGWLRTAHPQMHDAEPVGGQEGDD
jgi:hypothetical protein